MANSIPVQEWFNYGENYALEWYKHAHDKCEDPIFKFMVYWMAFNWLYGKGGGNEIPKIKKFCDEYYSKRLYRFDAFATGAYHIIEESPVRGINHGVVTLSGKRDHDTLLNGTDAEATEALLLTIYRIRCNLFHGSKSLVSLENPHSRDRALVNASATIMKGYLKALLFEDPSF